jgi:hypothetical protein
MGERQNRKAFVATKIEKVNHPTHYIDDNGRECIDVMIDTFGKNEVAIFCKLNAFKYMWRAGKKPGSPKQEDLKKAEWYIAKQTELATE